MIQFQTQSIIAEIQMIPTLHGASITKERIGSVAMFHYVHKVLYMYIQTYIASLWNIGM